MLNKADLMRGMRERNASPEAIEYVSCTIEADERKKREANAEPQHRSCQNQRAAVATCHKTSVSKEETSEPSKEENCPAATHARGGLCPETLQAEEKLDEGAQKRNRLQIWVNDQIDGVTHDARSKGLCRDDWQERRYVWLRR